MKKLITAALGLLFVVCVSYTAVAGNLDSPGAPSAGSGMYTLQNLYDYIVSGAVLEGQTGFQEPILAPGSTMKTTKEIGDVLKSLYEQCPVTVADVKSGVKFFCTQPGSWGVQTGTAIVITPTPTLTPTATPTVWGSAACEAKDGYWYATQLGYDGCWIKAAVDASCTSACQNKGLTCLANNWDIDANATVCKHYFPEVTEVGGCSAGPLSAWPRAMSGGGCCQPRGTGTNQDCNAIPESMEAPRFCVCS